MNSIARAIIKVCRRDRAPDQVIGGHARPFLLRWFVIPRNRFFNMYLHQVVRDDDDRALHDHPWASCSIVLAGGYNEELLHHGCLIKRFRAPGSVRFRSARAAHRLELPKSRFDPEYRRACWTLFLTGPRIRTWGFHCESGWVDWRNFVSADGVSVGAGCEGGVTPPDRPGGDPGKLVRRRGKGKTS